MDLDLKFGAGKKVSFHPERVLPSGSADMDAGGDKPLRSKQVNTMTIHNVVDGIRVRAEMLRGRGRNVVSISGDTLSDLRTIAKDRLRELSEDCKTAVLDFYDSAKAGVSQARMDGVKAVVKKPNDYLPASGEFAAALGDRVIQLKAITASILKTTQSGVLDLKSTLSNTPKAKPGRKSMIKKIKPGVVPIKKTSKRAA